MAVDQLRTQLEHLARDLGGEAAGAAVVLERPRNPEHGDLATNLALALASTLKRPPRQIAQELLARLDLTAAGVAATEIAGPGFINFRLAQEAVWDRLSEILALDARYGRSEEGAGRPVLVEFVSANPTGPLHVGHGRQAGLGDAISTLLEWTGWGVKREFYYNDSGKQMDLLADSVRARYRQALGRDTPFPEQGYHGDYVRELAARLIEVEGDRYVDDDSTAALDAMRRFAAAALREEQDRDLEGLRVRFDTHFLESSLYESGKVEETVARLRETGLAYEREGALWLRTTEFGDQKDRVMVRSNGMPTYFLPDVAYHLTKWERGFRDAIDVQGADHHGTVARVRAGLRALGLPAGWPEYVLHQMVTVQRGGEEVRFSKRAGSYVTLRELVEQVGVDVTRYFFLMRRADAHMTFDLDLALDESEKNPVYKVQYAHARMMSIFAKAGAGAEGDAEADLSLLRTEAERELIQQLALFPEVVHRAAEGRTPHIVCEYLESTAGAVNSWYHAGNPSRNPELAVLVEDERLRRARLALARGVRIVLRNGLGVLGLTAPDRMRREDTE
ncbi:MAG: arginine--tRNA ligase [Longimicrobiales bacterium]